MSPPLAAVAALLHHVIEIIRGSPTAAAMAGLSLALAPVGLPRLGKPAQVAMSLGGFTLAAVAMLPFVGPAKGAKDATKPKKPSASTPSPSRPDGLGTGLPVKSVAATPPPKAAPAAAPAAAGASAPTSDAPAAPVALTGSAALLAKMRSKAAPPTPAAPAAAAPAPAAPAGNLTGSQALLAKMRRNKAAPPPTVPAAGQAAALAPADGEAFLWILYGGEAAKSVSKDLAAECAAKSVPAKLESMEKFKECNFDKEPAKAVFVVETVENAQPAEAAGACVRFFNRKRKAKKEGLLAGKLQYAVLAIGDTNLLLDRQTTTAKDCNQAGQALDAALNYLGATRMCTRGEANDAVGLEEAVEPWKDQKFWPAVLKAFKGGDGDAKELLILYGSQTGNSAEIAKQIGADCPSQGVKAKVRSMEEVDFESCLLPGTVVLYVVSSTGDGDPPDNCAKFYSEIRKRSHPDGMMRGVQYTVLGLGDQNYTAFMAVPRLFHKRMDDLGALCFYPRGEADEVEGLDEYVEEWTHGLWAPLKKTLCAATPTMVSETAEGAGKEEEGLPTLKGVPSLPPCRLAVTLSGGTAAEPVPAAGDGGDDGLYSATAPWMAAVTESRLLTAPTSDRRVLHTAVSIAGSKMQYRPGDALGMLPVNDPVMVDTLLERLGHQRDGTKVVSVAAAKGGGAEDVPADKLAPHLRPGLCLRDVLLHCTDLTQPPKKTLVRALGEYTTEPKEQHTLLHWSSRGGKPAYDKEVKDAQPTLMQLLTKFPSCNPPLDVLLDTLPPLAPRYYSLTCAPEEHPTECQVAFSVVNFTTDAGFARAGVATNWLDRVAGPAMNAAPPASLPVFLKRGGPFHAPNDLIGATTIMVGPGTGVAPFRGFLQARRAALATAPPSSSKGEAWLFFGCRKPDEDYLYREDFELMAKDGTLTKLETAFSRVTENKVYVQHRLLEHGPKICEMVLAGAYFYVCGDGGQMAKDVNHTLVTILETHSGMKAKDVSTFVRKMIEEQKYVRDIWS